MTKNMLSIKKCIKRGAATILLLIAAITIQADNVMKRHADGTCSVNTRTICKPVAIAKAPQ